MKARSPIRWLIVLLLAVAFVGVSYAYVQWGPPWPSSTTTFYVKYDNGTYDTAFIEAMNKWNGLSNFSFTSNTSTYVDPCNSVSSPDYLNGYNFSSDDCGRGWGGSTLAVCWTWYSGSTRLDTDVVFNSNRSWGVHDGTTTSPYDFKRVAVHEVGHALGLGHETTNTAIMNPYYSTTIIGPQTDDINGLVALYGATSPVSPVEAFVTRFYQQCLNRGPDQLGLNNWVNGLNNGSMAGADVAYGFVFSDEFINRNTTNADFVTILYRAFFDREPDPPGYAGWLSDLDNGESRGCILKGFIGSQEFINLCAEYGISAIIGSIDYMCTSINSNPYTGLISLRAYNGQYLVAEGEGGDLVYADSDVIDPWEKFELVDLGNNMIALKAYNGQYLVAEGGGGDLVYADSDAIGPWEKFELVDLGNNMVALKAYNSQYLVAEGGGGDLVYADSDAIGPWEKFEKIVR